MTIASSNHREDVRATPLRRLWNQAGSHRPQLIKATLLSVANKAFDVLPEFLIGIAVDIISRGDRSFVASATGITDRWDQLLALVAVTIAIWVGESVTDYLASITWRNLAQDLQHDLRTELYRHLQTLDLAWFEDRSSGGLLSILNDDINQLERFLDIGARDIVLTTTNVVLLGSFYIVTSPVLALICFIPIPVIVVVVLWWQRRLAPRYAEVRQRVEDLSATFVNNLSGMATITAFTAEKREAEHVDALSRRYRDTNYEAIKFSSAFVPLIRMAILTSFVATLLVGGRMVIDGSLNLGVYSSLVYATQRMLWPFTRLGETSDLYRRAAASVDRILDLNETEPTILPGHRDLPTPARGEISCTGVSFTYPDHNRYSLTARPDTLENPSDLNFTLDSREAIERFANSQLGDSGSRDGGPVLRDINLTISAGETHAFVGTTGSGKSTLLKLLLRQYEPEAGCITFDGISLEELSFASHRGAIGYVAQDAFLFDGTIRDNLAYGAPAASDQELRHALELAEASEFCDSLPNGWDTLIGERGQKLSGGQRQRIALARAIARNPAVLMLDEATSAVDNETEAAIQRSLAIVSRDRTTIVVAHRLSTVRHATQIHVIENGVIAENGTHEELLIAGGLYAALWRVQTGDSTPTA